MSTAPGVSLTLSLFTVLFVLVGDAQHFDGDV
jgi:hypothetical protein